MTIAILQMYALRMYESFSRYACAALTLKGGHFSWQPTGSGGPEPRCHKSVAKMPQKCRSLSYQKTFLLVILATNDRKWGSGELSLVVKVSNVTKLELHVGTHLRLVVLLGVVKKYVFMLRAFPPFE
jgi:hypothetical protein